MTDDEFFRPLLAELQKLAASEVAFDEHPERMELEQRIKQRLNGDLEDFLYDEKLVKVVQHGLSCPVCLAQAASWHEEQTARKRKPSWPWGLPERINAFGDLSSKAALYVPALYTAAVLLLALAGVLVHHFWPFGMETGAGSGNPPPYL